MGRGVRLQERTFPLTIFVDTSVWSSAFRRDQRIDTPEVLRLVSGIEAGEVIITTGLVLQEILQGFHGPRDREAILLRFAPLPLLSPDRRDHVEAAELRNLCRRHGVQIGTIDALLAQLCIRHELTLLTSDGDFLNMSHHCPLELWREGAA
jgi:predicted nucleic acid-binding protein